MHRCAIQFLLAALVGMIIIEQSSASTRSNNESIFPVVSVNTSGSKTLAVPLRTRTAGVATAFLNPARANSTPTLTPTIKIPPALKSRTVTESLALFTKEGHRTITPTLTSTVSAPTFSVIVYFEATSQSLTPEDLMDLIRLVLWNGTDHVDMVSLPFTAPWIKIAFTSSLYAAEAYQAANTKHLSGVARAVYEVPSIIPDEEGGKSYGIVTAIMVVLVLVVVGFGVYWLFFRNKGRQDQESYDGDNSANTEAQPINLNETLLMSYNNDSTDEADEKSNLLKHETKQEL